MNNIIRNALTANYTVLHNDIINNVSRGEITSMNKNDK